MNIKFLQNPIQTILILILCSVFCVFVILNRTLIIDDAYITFQYARNFAEHLKPWYNLDPFYQGNGQTSLLWMGVLSAFNWVGLKSEKIFYIVNILIGIFLIIQAVSLIFKEQKPLKKVFRVIFSLFFTYWMALNSTHGLETILSTFVLYMFLKDWKNIRNPYSLLLVLVRPEFGIFLVFWFLNSNFSQKKEVITKFLYSSAGILIFALFYFIFYKFYIPLPFILKSNFNSYSYLGFKVFLGRFILFSPVILALLYKKNYFKLIPLVFLIFFYSFNISSYSSGIYIRYFFPLTTYFLIADFDFSSHNFYRKATNLVVSCVLLASALRMIDLSKNFYDDRQGVITDNEGFYSSYGVLAKKLKKSDRVIIMDAGHVAYFSPATVYDGYGLNDATMLLARKHSDTATYRNYVDTRKINIVSVVSKDSLTFNPRIDSGFTYKSLNLQHKKLLYKLPMDSNFYLFVYQYKD